MSISDLDPIIIDDDSIAPDTSNLTTNSVDGTGVFDVLMKSVKLHLVEEYKANRITGEQYSTVYIGALGAVLQQSTAYLLNIEQGKKIKADIGLTRQKTVTEIVQTADTIPTGLGFNLTADLQGLLSDQKDLVAKQSLLIDEQIDGAKADKDLVGQKIISELGETGVNLVTAKAAGYGYNSLDVIDGAMTGAKDKSVAEAEYAVNRAATELASTVTPTAGLTKIAYDLQTSQKEKAAQEVILLAQKTISELAQTSDTVPTNTLALNTSPTVTGVIDDQKLLFTAQTDGFARDAEQKLTRMMIDAFIVQASDGSREATNENYLSDPRLGAMIKKAAFEVGVDLPVLPNEL